ncbi:hypothetical protein HDU91_002847, partial [Kappamyces sp. JEL0680]
MPAEELELSLMKRGYASYLPRSENEDFLRDYEEEMKLLSEGTLELAPTEVDAELEDMLNTTGIVGGERSPEHHAKSSVAKAAFNMTKTIVGAGVFGLPATFQKAGFVLVIFLIVVMALFIYWTLQVLLAAGLDAGVTSYHDLMRKTFGKRGAQLYGIFAFLFAFGGCCAYTVIVGDTVPVVVRALFGVSSLPTTQLSFWLRLLTDRRVSILLCSYLIMLPVSSVRNITSLAKYSIFALGAIVLIAISVVISGYGADASLRGSSSDVFTVIKWSGLSGAIGTLCFAYVCHHNTFIIYTSLRFPTIANFNTVNMASLGYAMLASLAIGTSGYVVFTDKIKSNVLNCFSDSDGLINFARLLFALDMFLTYPLELFIARNTIFKTL